MSVLTGNIVQIAGIRDEAEAEMLRSLGVRYLGFPLRLNVHREDLSEEHAGQIIRSLRPPIYGVVITYESEPRQVAALCASTGASIVQLHGDIEAGELSELKRIAPHLVLIKSLVVGLHSIETLESLVARCSSLVDAFITDTFDAETGASGATGKTHDWGDSRRLVELSDRPVILAGGLRPENVRRAILEVKPAGVDAHTGVEDAAGRKCPHKVERFVREARAGFRRIAGGRE